MKFIEKLELEFKEAKNGERKFNEDYIRNIKIYLDNTASIKENIDILHEFEEKTKKSTDTIKNIKISKKYTASGRDEIILESDAEKYLKIAKETKNYRNIQRKAYNFIVMNQKKKYINRESETKNSNTRIDVESTTIGEKESKVSSYNMASIKLDSDLYKKLSLIGKIDVLKAKIKLFKSIDDSQYNKNEKEAVIDALKREINKLRKQYDDMIRWISDNEPETKKYIDFNLFYALSDEDKIKIIEDTIKILIPDQNPNNKAYIVPKEKKILYDYLIELKKEIKNKELLVKFSTYDNPIDIEEKNVANDNINDSNVMRNNANDNKSLKKEIKENNNNNGKSVAIIPVHDKLYYYNEELEKIRSELDNLFERGNRILNMKVNKGIAVKLVIHNSKFRYIPEYCYERYKELRKEEKRILKSISKYKKKKKKGKMKTILGIGIIISFVSKIFKKNYKEKIKSIFRKRDNKKTFKEKYNKTTFVSKIFKTNYKEKIKSIFRKRDNKKTFKEKYNNIIIVNSMKKKKNRIIAFVLAASILFGASSLFASRNKKTGNAINSNIKPGISYTDITLNNNVKDNINTITKPNKENNNHNIPNNTIDNNQGNNITDDKENNTNNDSNNITDVKENNNTNNNSNVSVEDNSENQKEDITLKNVSLNDIIKLEDNSKIYTNAYDATYGTNSYNAYYDNEYHRVVEGVVYELNGDIYTIYNTDSEASNKIEYLEKNEAKLTAVLVCRTDYSNGNNYEGYYSFNNVKTLKKTK